MLLRGGKCGPHGAGRRVCLSSPALFRFWQHLFLFAPRWDSAGWEWATPFENGSTGGLIVARFGQSSKHQEIVNKSTTTQMWDRWVKAAPVGPHAALAWGSFHVGQLWKPHELPATAKTKMCLTDFLFHPVRLHRCGSCVSSLRSQVSVRPRFTWCAVSPKVALCFHVRNQVRKRGLPRWVWGKRY